MKKADFLFLGVTFVLIVGLPIVVSLAQQANVLPNVQPIPSPPGYQFNLRTVAQLPTCNANSKGTAVAVTDASSPTYGSTLTGGSTGFALAMCDGTNWTGH